MQAGRVYGCKTRKEEKVFILRCCMPPGELESPTLLRHSDVQKVHMYGIGFDTHLRTKYIVREIHTGQSVPC